MRLSAAVYILVACLFQVVSARFTRSRLETGSAYFPIVFGGALFVWPNFAWLELICKLPLLADIGWKRLSHSRGLDFLVYSSFVIAVHVI